MKHLTIAAKDVKPGMYLHNPGAWHPSGRWLLVKEVNTRENGDIVIATTVWYTRKHPEEAVAVREL